MLWTLLIQALLVSAVVADPHYRLSPASTHLKVESCRDISDGMWGDPAGSCAEQGYGITCTSCGRGAMKFAVKARGTCDQKQTKCYFRSENEECVGSSQCQYAESSPRDHAAEVLSSP